MHSYGHHEADVWSSDDVASDALVLGSERTRAATFAIGALLGAIGGALSLVCAGAIATRAHDALSIARDTGAMWSAGYDVALGVAAGAGAVAGGVLALVMQHGARWIGRLIFACANVAAAWLLFHVELAAHHRATLPLVPMLLGTSAFAAMIAFIPPSRRY